MQDVLQFRLNLLTEIMSKTKDPNETNELAQNGNEQTSKNWNLGKEESEKHVQMLKVGEPILLIRKNLVKNLF